MEMKPILFNTDMVCTLLEGRKTVTRRLVKQKYRNSVFEMFGDDLCEANPYRFVRQFVPCKPPYRPGDILYVRETWTQDGDVYRYKAGFYDQNRKWRPSIHMPREAARIFLQVTDVRVERLQDIDDDGVVAEGLDIGAPFEELWDRTIKPADRALYGWDANPWVWVIEFERCKKPEEIT